MNDASYELRPVGWVDSPLAELTAAPLQGDEGAPEAWIVFRPELRPALRHLEVGDHVTVLTWLHLADRSVLEVHPRGDRRRPLRGVFSTRSPDRPNLIGLHDVVILAIDDTRLKVSELEAVDGTPVLDLKPVLGSPRDR